MNPPTAMTRGIGKPRMAGMLYVAIALLGLGWMRGAVPWWLALIAVASVGKVASAARYVKSYNAWVAEWQAMGGHAPVAKKPAKREASRRVLALQAAIFALPALAIPACAPQGQKTPDALVVLWFVACVGLLWKLLQLLLAFRRSRTRSPEASTTGRRKKEADAVVTWLIDLPSSSPSRASAEAELPDYCARLIRPTRAGADFSLSCRS